MASTNATVVIASLFPNTTGAQAQQWIVGNTSNDRVEVLALDLSSFDAVRQCAKDFLALHSALDVLVNRMVGKHPGWA